MAVAKGSHTASADALSASLKHQSVTLFIYFWENVHKLNLEKIEQLSLFRTSNYFSGLPFCLPFCILKQIHTTKFLLFFF